MAKTWHTRHAKFIGDTDNAVRDHKDPTDTYFCPLAKLLTVHVEGKRFCGQGLWPGSEQGPIHGRDLTSPFFSP